MDLIRWLIQLYVYLVIAWIILSYVVELGRMPWGHPVRTIYARIGGLVEPVLRPIRRVIPPLRFGGMALDLSPLILIVGLQIIANILPR